MQLIYNVHSPEVLKILAPNTQTLLDMSNLTMAIVLEAIYQNGISHGLPKNRGEALQAFLDQAVAFCVRSVLIGDIEKPMVMLGLNISPRPEFISPTKGLA
jgi:hypothetical protein